MGDKMDAVLSTSSDAEKRPNGITIIAVLWTITSIFNINWGLETVLFSFDAIPYLPQLYDPSAPYWLDLSTRSREWISFGLPADIVLSFSIVVLSILTVFVAYGLYTAKSWSYKSSFAILISTAIIDSALAILYASAPGEMWLTLDFYLYYVLALINMVWITIISIYLTKPNIKQYIMGSSPRPITPKAPFLPISARARELISWINQWKAVRKLDFSLEHEHFFLEGRHLDDFSKELISHAKSEVLVVNPFIQDCDLSNTLSDVKKNGIDVRIITRPPKDKFPEHLKNKQEYHTKLKQKGISLVYEKKVHAKLILVDRTVAIISSMNFYPDSSAGVSWEAGLVSINKGVVDSIVNLLPSKFT